MTTDFSFPIDYKDCDDRTCTGVAENGFYQQSETDEHLRSIENI